MFFRQRPAAALSLSLPDVTGRRRFAGDRRGVAAIEFAFVAAPLLLLICGTLEFGYVQWIQANLDFATQKAARRVMTAGGMNSASDFRSLVCGSLPATVTCSNLVVQARVFTNGSSVYKTTRTRVTLPVLDLARGNQQWCTGGPNDYIFIETGYALPAIIPMISKFGAKTIRGRKVWPIYADAMVQNEPLASETGC